MPGVVNCFSCALDSNGSVVWQFTVNDGPAPFAATDENFLVIEMPENYVHLDSPRHKASSVLALLMAKHLKQDYLLQVIIII